MRLRKICVEADPSEPDRRLTFTPRVRQDHDGVLAAEHRARPRGELAAEPDVDAAGQVAALLMGWSA